MVSWPLHRHSPYSVASAISPHQRHGNSRVVFYSGRKSHPKVVDDMNYILTRAVCVECGYPCALVPVPVGEGRLAGDGAYIWH